MSAVGDLFGIPVIASPHVAAGQVYVLNGYIEPFRLARSLYAEPPETIKGYVQRKANALRERWGLEPVDYAWEDDERERARRLFAYAAANRFAPGVREVTSIITAVTT